MEANCWSLSQLGMLEAGIPLNNGGRFTDHMVLRSAEHNPTRVIFRGMERNCYPSCSEGRLIQAAPYGKQILTGKAEWAGGMFFVATQGLQFDRSLSTSINISNAWPGAETLRMDQWFVQSGRRNSLIQQQLIAFKDGESMFVADQNHRYILITWSSGRFSTEPASVEQFAQALSERAKSLMYQCHAHSMLTWTFHTLEGLKMLRYWTVDLAQRRAELSG
jgi:hypothetical protein